MLAAIDVFRMWGWSGASRDLCGGGAGDFMVEGSRPSSLKEMESLLRMLTGIPSNKLDFVSAHKRRGCISGPGWALFLMSPFMLLTWSKERSTDHDTINRTSKIWRFR